MMFFNKILRIECDIYKSKKFCWREIVIGLEENEIKSQAIHYAQKMGWKTKPEACICPYCSDGIKKKEVELKLIQGGL